jgi:hypothetical protein
MVGRGGKRDSGRTAQLSSVLSLGIVAVIGPLIYGIVYLGVGACGVEQETYRGIALSTIRFAKAQLKYPCCTEPTTSTVTTQCAHHGYGACQMPVQEDGRPST